jgi:hypothetical protein
MKNMRQGPVRHIRGYSLARTADMQSRMFQVMYCHLKITINMTHR